MGVRISALPALSTLTSDDITVFVNDTGGANPVTSKVNFADLRTSVLAGTALDTISVTANGDTLITGGASNTTLLQGEIIQNTANNNYISGNNLEIDAITTFTGNSFTMNTILTNTGNTILGTPYQTQQVDENGAPVYDSNGDAVLVEFVPVTQIDGTLVINASANVVGLSLLDLDNANGDNIADGTADQVLATDGSGNFKFTNSLPFGSVDLSTTPDGSSLVYNDGVYGTANWNHSNPFTVTLSEEHHFSNGDIATIDADGQTYDGQSYYVGVVNSTHIGFYSDPALTAPIDGSGFSATPNTDATITQSDGAQFEPRSLLLNDLGNVNATPTNGQVLTWNGSSNLWYGADSTGGGGSEASGGVDVDSTSLADGDTIVWDDQQYTIVDLIDDPNDATKIIIDFGTQAHGQIGASAWGIFNGSGGSTELNLSEYHKIVQINSDASVNSYYTLSFGNATSDTVSDTDLASNTSAWTSGGYFQTVVTVDGATSNTDGHWIATAQSELAPDLSTTSIGALTDVETASAGHVPSDGQVLTWHASMNHWMPGDIAIPGAANTGGVAITNPEGDLVEGQSLQWHTGTITGQFAGGGHNSIAPTWQPGTVWEVGWADPDPAPGTNKGNPDPTDYWGHVGATSRAVIDASDYERIVGRFVGTTTGSGSNNTLNGRIVELLYKGDSGTFRRDYWIIKLDQSTQERLTHANGDYQFFTQSDTNVLINPMQDPQPDAAGFERLHPGTLNAYTGWVAFPEPEADISDSPLGELKDVDVSGVADGNIIKYVAANTTYVAASLDDVLESTGAPVMYGPGGEKANTALFNEGDTLTWDNQQYSISAVSLDDPAVVTLSGDHTLQDGAYIQITGVVGMTELNSNFYYVNAISNTQVELYTDAGLTTGVDSVGFTAYSSGGTLAGPGNWSVGSGSSGSGSTTLGGLTDFDLIDEADRTDGDALIWDSRSFTITNATQSNPPIITLSEDHNMVVTDANVSQQNLITISGVVGMEYVVSGYTYNINKQWKVRTEHANGTPLASNELALYSASYPTNWTPEDLTSATAYVSGGSATFASGGRFVLGTPTRTLGELSDVDLTGVADGNSLQYVAANTTWVVGSGGGGGASVTVSDNPPSSPSSGDLWWESDTGKLKVYYNDGTSSQWVDSFTAGSAADKNIFSGATKEEVNIVASAGSGAVDYDCSTHSIHHLSSITGDIQANLTNLAVAEGYATTISFVIVQGTTARIVDALSIGGTSQTLRWVGGSVPSGTNSGVDVQTFSIIRTGASSYTVLAQLVPFS